eukprot:6196058-Pleurochrysis_carterae.AAC.2
MRAKLLASKLKVLLKCALRQRKQSYAYAGAARGEPASDLRRGARLYVDSHESKRTRSAAPGAVERRLGSEKGRVDTRSARLPIVDCRVAGAQRRDCEHPARMYAITTISSEFSAPSHVLACQAKVLALIWIW